MAKEQKISIVSRLLRMFNLGVDKSQKMLRPTLTKSLGKTKTTQFDEFPSSVQKFMNYWMSQCHDNYDSTSYENRKALYLDIDNCYVNSPILSRAMDLMADEVVQADTNFRIIDIEASPKVQDFFREWSDSIGLDKQVRPAALDIIKYGNGGWVPSTDDTGVNGVIPIKISDLMDRIEFSAHELKKKMKDQNSIINKMMNSKKMKMLVDGIVKHDNVESYLKNYLFGFQIGDFVLPPWKFIHFRNLVNESPFSPFGQPFFIHSIAAYRQYDAAMSLQVAARAARFPIYVYEINLPGGMAWTEKMSSVEDFITNFENSGMHSVRKEEFGVGERMFTIKDLFTFNQITPDIDLGRLDDIDMMRDDLILSTGMPRNFLDPNNGAFGNSGMALIQQFKPFARKCFIVQSIILDGVSQLFKIHMILSGKFKDDDIDFQLTMPYPESQTDRELIGSQSDLLNLANGVLDAIAQRVVGDPNAVLPPELVKDVYSQILPYDTSRIDDWVKGAIITKQDTPVPVPGENIGNGEIEGGGTATTPSNGVEEEIPTDEGGEIPLEEPTAAKESSSHKKKKMSVNDIRRFVEHDLGRKNYQESVRIILFEEKQKKLRNGHLIGKHIYSSKILFEGFPAENLRKLMDAQVMKLLESRKEEIKSFAEELNSPWAELKEELYPTPISDENSIETEIDRNNEINDLD